MQLSWLSNYYFFFFQQAPREDLRHGTILGYYIGYRPSDSDEPFQYKNVESAPSSPGLSYLTNLRRLTRYAVIVQAYNNVGAGPRSDEVLATTLEAGTLVILSTFLTNFSVF